MTLPHHLIPIGNSTLVAGTYHFVLARKEITGLPVARREAFSQIPDNTIS